MIDKNKKKLKLVRTYKSSLLRKKEQMARKAKTKAKMAKMHQKYKLAKGKSKMNKTLASRRPKK